MRFSFFLLDHFHRLPRNIIGVKELSNYKEICKVPARVQVGLMGCTAEEELAWG